jgi:hypothetical protein
MQIKINCSAYFVPADGTRLPFFLGSGDLGTSPFFGQLSVKANQLDGALTYNGSGV